MKKTLLILFLIPFLSLRAQLFAPFGNSDGTVYCIKTDTVNNAIYAGGSFNKIADGLYNVSNMAKYDGSTWSNFGGGGTLGGPVLAIEIYKGNVYIAGQSSFVRYWIGTRWEDTPGTLNGTVQALAVYNGELYVGGDFEYANGLLVN